MSELILVLARKGIPVKASIDFLLYYAKGKDKRELAMLKKVILKGSVS